MMAVTCDHKPLRHWRHTHCAAITPQAFTHSKSLFEKDPKVDCTIAFGLHKIVFDTFLAHDTTRALRHLPASQYLLHVTPAWEEFFFTSSDRSRSILDLVAVFLINFIILSTAGGTSWDTAWGHGRLTSSKAFKRVESHQLLLLFAMGVIQKYVGVAY